MGRTKTMKLSTALLAASSTLDAAAISSNDFETAAGQKWIVCYHTNWSQYRNTPGKFYPEDIDGSLCTHLIYSFSKMCKDGSGWTMCPYEWNDMDESWADGMYTRFNNLKVEQPHLKTLLAVEDGTTVRQISPLCWTRDGMLSAP